MQPSQLRVMLLVSNLQIGGAQEIVRTLAEQFAVAGCQPVVCTFQDGPLRPKIEEAGVPVEFLPQRRYSVLALPLFLADMIRIRRALLNLVDKYGINVVQTQLLRGLDFLVLTLRLSRKLLIFWTIHNVYFVLREEHLPRSRWLLGPKKWTYRQLYRLGAHWVNGFITVSEDVRRAVVEYLGRADGKVSLITNSVDVSRYSHPVDKTQVRQGLGIPAGAQVMAMVATLKAQKGHRFLLDATPAVVSQFPDLHILFIGDGELRQQLEAQTRALKLEDHVHFLGLRDDVPDLLGASDIFVLSSLWEGLPMALIEAMASGLPVIATEVSGTRDVMVDGQTGLLVPPGDVESLRNAMIDLLSDPDRAKAMGIAARKRVAALFSAEKQSRQHLQLYFQQWNQTLA